VKAFIFICILLLFMALCCVFYFMPDGKFTYRFPFIIRGDGVEPQRGCLSIALILLIAFVAAILFAVFSAWTG
jgi:hypothetical protein